VQPDLRRLGFIPSRRLEHQAITASSIVRMLEQSDSFGNRFSLSVQWFPGQGAALSLARIAKQLSHKTLAEVTGPYQERWLADNSKAAAAIAHHNSDRHAGTFSPCVNMFSHHLQRHACLMAVQSPGAFISKSRMAAWQKCALVQKLRASRLRMRRAGQRCEGKKPYGHTPDEAKVVDSILALRGIGKSYVAIADQLNGGGIKPRSGEKWHPTQVQRVIHRATQK
jgi:hypothetical protein